MRARRWAGVMACAAFALLTAAPASAAPLEPEELAKVCAQADGPAHCGRLVEEVQLKRLPNLAVRDGNALRVSLYPSGAATFTDTDTLNGGRAYSLWDFISEINAVVLFSNDGDDANFTLVLRATGGRIVLPAEPRLSPDRARLVTADFCAKRCVNELAVWRITRDGVRKELSWAPKEAWTDSVATWKGSDAIAVQYTPALPAAPGKLERRLTDPDWIRHPAP